MAAEDYILSFDFEAITRQIAELRDTYSALSSEFNGVSDNADARLESLNAKVISISASLGSSISKIDQFYSGLNNRLGVTSNHFKDLEQYSKSVYENFNKISQVDLDKASDQVGGQEAVKARQEAVSGFAMSIETDGSKESIAIAQAALAAAQKAKKEAEEAKSAVGNLGKKIKDTITKEMKNAKSKMGGILGGFSGGALAGGGLMAILGMIILGQKEKQRKGAESGEMLNAFEAMGNVFSKETQKANRWFSRFAEHAQYHFGIGRKEIQSVIQAMGESGFNDILDSNFNKPITSATANIATASIALDKLLNQATGTSMQKAIEMSNQYNMTLEDSVNMYTKVAMAARGANMDFNKFIETVMAGKSSVSQYGIEVSSVGNAILTLKKQYAEMGVSEQMAGSVAAKRVGGAMDALGNLSDPILADMGMEILYSITGKQPSSAIQARTQMKDLQLNVGLGENDEILKAMLSYIDRRIAKGGSDAERTFSIEKVLGISYDAAKGLLDLINRPMEKGMTAPLTKEERAELTNAFKTEGSKLTQIQKNQRDLIDALAKTGQGLLKVMTSILGVLAGLGISLPIIAKAAGQLILKQDVEGANKTLGALKDYMVSQGETFVSGGREMIEGLEQTAKASGAALETVVGPMDAFGKLMDANKESLSSINGKIEKVAQDTAVLFTSVDGLTAATTSLNARVTKLMNLAAEKVGLGEEGSAEYTFQQQQAEADREWQIASGKSAKRASRVKGAVSAAKALPALKLELKGTDIIKATKLAGATP